MHERFESGFRDLTLRVKVLRREDQKSKIQNIFFTNIIFKTYFTKQKKGQREDGRKKSTGLIKNRPVLIEKSLGL